MPNKSGSEGMRRRFNIILSVIIAFSAWIYVVYNINPTVTRTYYSVPVKPVHEEYLKNNRLAIKSIGTERVNVTVQGRRSIIESLTDKDIAATVDVADIGKGTNRLAINITVPNGIMLKRQNEKRADVTIEDRDTKKVAVNATFEGRAEGGTEPLITEKSADEVEISGAKSLVEKVSYAQVGISASKISGKARTFELKPVPVASGGKRVKFIDVNPNEVSVTAVSTSIKEVKLRVRVNNPDVDRVKRTYKAPSTIYIKGMRKDLEKVREIETSTVDLSGITASQEIKLDYILPKGIELANKSEGLMLKVTVTGSRAAEIALKPSDIRVINVKDGLAATIETDNILLTATGYADVTDKIAASDFSVHVDASGLKEGVYTLTPKVSYTKSYNKVTLNKDTIKVKLTNKKKNKKD